MTDNRKSTTGKKILIISNSPIHPSGVGRECGHICKALWQAGHDVSVLAYSLLPPADAVVHTFETGEQVRIYRTKLGASGKFDSLQLLMSIIDQERPSAMILFDDPHRFMQLLDHSSFIRSKMPLYGIMVWDTYLLPHEAGVAHFNAPIYENFDGIGCISRQTEWFVNRVYDKIKYSSKPRVSYVGHGSDPFVFKPLPDSELTDLRKAIFGGTAPRFVALMVGQNQGRKKFPDLIAAWRTFYEQLPLPEAEQSFLLLKTHVDGTYGTNLDQVIQALAPSHNVRLLPSMISDEDLNRLYNMADVTLNVSNAEGFGLTLNEASLSGRCSIVNLTGGLIDQVGHSLPWSPNLKDELLSMAAEGNWIYPLDNQRTIIGSGQGTFYLYDENCKIDAITNGLKYWYSQTPEYRAACGLAARQWTISNGLTGQSFALNVVRDLESVMSGFAARSLFQLYKVL